ncbi:MAG: glycosyltransferase family 2 protein [Bacteroides sp.]|nr:glycosyltransferase family 2 protein [Bacteroides sp.]
MCYNYSIIIPHYNIPRLLCRCLSSIPRRKDIQIIVVDDNSSSDIVDFNTFPGLDDPLVEVYFTKEGKGAGYARNIGLQHAKGKWLLFADADDFFVRNAFNTIDTFVDNEAELILFKTDSVNSDTLEPSNRNVLTNIPIDKYTNGNLTAKNVAFKYVVPWGKMIKRSYVGNNHFTFEELIVSNDVMFAIKVACHTEKILICPKNIYCNTYRENSLLTSKKHIDIRMDCLIRRNEYLLKYGYKKEIVPLLVHLHHFCKHSIKTYLKCLWMLVSKGVLFQGLYFYFKR